MIEVFKTNVKRRKESEILLLLLSRTFPSFKINFDLDDCDKILRIQGNEVHPVQVVELVEKNGYQCEILE
ncbi:hypothetical protein QEG73_11165 [Chitinophagaceae bacterium 26-R-25]|nr:hypothetical protein [Chitinophagaceae bacterium 26-R-25]